MNLEPDLERGLLESTGSMGTFRGPIRSEPCNVTSFSSGEKSKHAHSGETKMDTPKNSNTTLGQTDRETDRRSWRQNQG